MQALHDPAFDDVFEAQQVFRLLLDAVAWPGKVNLLPPTRVQPPAPWPPHLIQVGRTLLDGQVTFAVHGPNAARAIRYLEVNTGARPRPLEAASFVLALPPYDDLDVAALTPGSLIAPERSATLVLGCHAVASPTAPGGVAVGLAAVTLHGRGVRPGQQLVVDEAVLGVLHAVAERHDEYPMGVDVILVDSGGHVVGLPRTTRWRGEAKLWAM
jgi:alpha-D-ribose 1-methylphosphonate 5-triphosphate synthase subunit PhnH